jgi:MFS family permease
LCLAVGGNLAVVFAGIALWGLHMGMTQGVLSALVAAAAPLNRRGAAFGIYHFSSGIALLGGSLLAGLFWMEVSPRATFLFGTGTSLLALATVVILSRAANHLR